MSLINKSIFLIVFSLSTIIIPACSLATPQKPAQLKFASTNPKETKINQWLSLVYIEALGRMGIKFEFVEVPPKRSSYYSDYMVVDGQLSRILTYGETHPDMVLVKEHVIVVRFYAYSTNPNINLQGWKSLKGKGYSVDYRLGVTRCEQQLVPVDNRDKFTPVTKIDLSIKKLIHGRLDFYVDYAGFMADYLKSDSFKQASEGNHIYRVGLLEEITGHAFLHQKHRHLEPELSSILRDMKQEGLFRKYQQETGLEIEID